MSSSNPTVVPLCQPTNTPVIHIVCRTGAYEGDGEFEYAVIELDLPLVMELLKLIGIASVFKSANDHFYRASFFMYVCNYYPDWRAGVDADIEIPVTVSDAVDEYKWVQMPQWYRPPEQASHCEAPTAEIGESSVIFQCCPYAGSATEIQTQLLSKEQLAEYANELMVRHAQKQATTATTATTRRRRVIDIDHKIDRD